MKLHIYIVAGFSLLALPACKTTGVPTLKSFESDGCTSFPDGPAEDPDLWCAACHEHDFLYWKGGTFADRLAADRKLKSEITETGHPLAGAIAFAGVRAGGSPFLPTPWRWGYGWKQYPRGYRPLTEGESKRVKAATPAPLRKLHKHP